MKKFLAIMVLVFAFLATLPITIEAHPGCRRHRGNSARRYQTAGYTYQRPSFYRRHRNVINIGLGAGGGALAGGLIGGNRKSMGIGALIGAGSGALYTYVLNPKKKRRL